MFRNEDAWRDSVYLFNVDLLKLIISWMLVNGRIQFIYSIIFFFKRM